jgi:hypothetical protein
VETEGIRRCKGEPETGEECEADRSAVLLEGETKLTIFGFFLSTAF